MSLLSVWLPPQETEFFARLPERARAKARILWEVCTRAATARNGERKRLLEQEAQRLACLHVAVGGEVVRLPKSFPSLKRIFSLWQKSGCSWRVLVDAWDLEGERETKLPPAFLEYWRSLCQRNQRQKCKTMHRRLIAQWQRWIAGDAKSAIPGYAEPPAADPNTGIPKGWAYRNLMNHKPTKFEQVAASVGRSAAADFRPKVFTTRVGLKVGQYFVFDDLWHDNKVNVIGQRGARRPLEFHALDLFSGCKFAWGMKPVLEDEVTGKMERLRESEMLFLVAHVLSAFGYRDDGTVFLVEHGTATLREDLEQKLFDLTQGKVRVERSGIEGAAAFAGMYVGRGKGNFRFKAALESLGNLIHNELADVLEVPGQTGSNSRLNPPEELYGRERHNDQLLRAMAALPPERAALLRLPFLEFNQFRLIAEEIYRRINARTDHELEGWVEAGLVAQEFRLAADQPWLPMERYLALPPANRNAIDVLLASDATLTRPRKLSPGEVFARDRGGMIQLPGHAVALLLATETPKEIRVLDDRLIEFTDSEIAPSELRFLARFEGATEMLQPGEKFAARVNPFDLSKLYLFDAKGGYLGACPAWEKVCKTDTAALHRQFGRVAKIESELLAPVAARGAALTRKRIEDAQWNAKVLGGKPVTTEEKARQSELAKRAREVGTSALDELSQKETSPAATGEVSATTTSVDQAEGLIDELLGE